MTDRVRTPLPLDKREKLRVRLCRDRWCIGNQLWAWNNTLAGAVFEASQLYLYGCRFVDIEGKTYD